MRVFQTVVDEGGFAAAARLLELSPPVVTRLVADLEQHLGTRLLQRTTRKLALTEAGDAYLARVRSILHEIEDAEAAAAASTRDLRGTVRVVAPPVVATNFLAPMLSHWHAQQPLLMLDIDIDPYASARVDEFDVTFMVAAEGFDANIVARPLMQGESIVVASPAYLLRHGTPRTVADLSDHHLITNSVNPLINRWPLLNAGKNACFVAQGGTRTDNSGLILALTRNGVGLGRVMDVLAAPLIRSGELVPVLQDCIDPQNVPIVAVMLQQRQRLPKIRACLDYWAECIGALGTPIIPA